MARDTILTQRLMLQIIKTQPLFQDFVCYAGKKNDHLINDAHSRVTLNMNHLSQDNKYT